MSSATKKMKKGDLLFREGEMSNAMYLIRTGVIRIFKKKGDSQIEIDNLRAGQIVGEMAFLDGNSRSASAEALMDAELVEISNEVYQTTMSQVPEWLKVLLKAIVARLRSTTTKVKNLESASAEVDYSDGAGRRSFVYLSTHDCLKIAAAVLLVASRSSEEGPEGKKLKISSLERYANQIMGIPLAKVTSFLDVLKQAGIAHFSDATSEVSVKDMNGLEQFIQFQSDENVMEPTKRHDISLRGFLIMGLIVKNLSKYKKDEASGMTEVNVIEVAKSEANAAGKEPFRMDEFPELVKLGYCTQLNIKSGTEQTTLVHADQFVRACRMHRIQKLIEALNEQKQKAQHGMK